MYKSKQARSRLSSLRENDILYKITIPITCHGDLQSRGKLRTPRYLNNRLTDGGEVVSSTHRPRFIPQKHYSLLPILISVSG
jgi:hypothetical protein